MHGMRRLYVDIADVKNIFAPTLFSVYFSACVIGYEERGVKTFIELRVPCPLEIGGAIYVRMAKSKKNKNKPKLNLTVREEKQNKIEQMDSVENHYVYNIIECIDDV